MRRWKGKKMSKGDVLWKIIENDTNKDKKLDVPEIMALLKKLCSDKLKEVEMVLIKYEK